MAKSLLVHCVCILCFLIAAALSRVQAQEAPQPAPVPAPSSNQTRPRAFFVFGDSLVDSGNNNFLATTARADMPPYGIDFPSHEPTGRFSNGYNIPDLISLRIGSEPTMPYLHPDLHGEKLLIGANFASAGVGILNDTGVQFVVVMRIWQQFEMFEQYKVRVRELIGGEKAEKLVKESLVLISLGGNDFVNNYFLLPITARSRQYALPAYVTLLISEYRNVLKRIYEMGPGRIIVTGTGPLGCVPAELAIWSSDGECAAQLQQAAKLFNPLLLEMIKDLNNQLPTAPHHHVFVAANALDINMDFIRDPHSFGFNTSKEACCGQGPYNGMGLCTPISRICQDRNSHVFWDAFHPTEKANRLIVNEIMTGSQQFMHPMNLSTIMALDSF